ncbi:MAG: MFS transporter [Candidatus Electrothrix aestuarii]|uniref:MFS transporter n=1 Tax=Candidatus Electrothrix aestuarii TaxID=3062594 RepID=A0AAU8LTY8_9BACT|nr:MFS transporter [Candidatus Electrothrix aestuarii]
MQSSQESQDSRSLLRDRNLHIIFSVTLMAVMGVASLTPAFPKIIQELHILPKDIGLLITAFTVPGVFLTPILGMLADRFGRKMVLAPSLFLFAIAGGACALTRDFHLLLILRFIQGAGAAALPAINTALIGDLYIGQERDTAMGYNTSVLSLGVASYPALGGLLAAAGWQYPFFLPLLALPVGFLVLFSLKNPEPKNTRSFKGYLNGIWQAVQQREVAVLFLASLVTFIILYGSYLTYFPLLLHQTFQANAPLIGLIMSGMACTMAFTSSQMGKLAKRYTKKQLLIAAYTLYAVALALIPFVPSIPVLLFPVVLFGIAQGLNIPTVQTMLTGLAPLEYRASFMAVNGMVLRLGQTLGPICMGIFFVLWGTDGAFLAGVGCALFMLIIFALLLKSPGR